MNKKCVMCYDNILDPIVDSENSNEFIFCCCECYEEFVELARNNN